METYELTLIHVINTVAALKTYIYNIYYRTGVHPPFLDSVKI
jgi:hypothetical protein